MRRHLGDWPLTNRHTVCEELAGLYTPIAENNVADFENIWKPQMDAKRATLKTAQDIQDANIQDRHWKWRDKNDVFTKRLDYESFSVECGGFTQGLMFVRTAGFAQIKSQYGLPIAYIDLVSTAPWNRWGFTKTPKYKGIGPLLLSAAISLSVHEGFDGRLGLHSLPQSESWYRKQGMAELGPDKSYPNNLVYFEFTSADAQAYVNSP